MTKDQTNPQIAGYHAHVYYDAATKPKAQQLAASALDALTVELAGFSDKPAGPHPVGNLLLTFKPAKFASVVPWLMLNRKGLDVLIHPLTDDAARDHDSDGLWLGTQLKLRPHTHSAAYAPNLLPTT